MIVVRVGRGDGGSCRHGCTVVGQGVVALVAIGDGADAERAHEACSSSRAGELPHGGGVRTRRCAVAIIMVVIIFGSGSDRWMLGEDGARLDCGQTVARRSIGGQAGRRAEARDHDRRSVSVAMIVTGVGLGDAGPFRRGGSDVRRGVVALVAIGGGAEAECSRGTSRPSSGCAARGGGRTRRCAVAMDIITGTSGSARGRCADRCSARRRGAARPQAGLRRRSRSRTRCCEASVRRRRASAEPDAVTRDGQAGDQDPRQRGHSGEEWTAHRERAAPARSAATRTYECALGSMMWTSAVGRTGRR